MKVFISHTAELAKYPTGLSFVDAAKAGVLDAGMTPVEHDHFGPSPGRPDVECCAYVDACDVWVGLIGLRYGNSVPQARQKTSFVEFEYQRAIERGLPCIALLLDDDRPVEGLPPNSLFDATDPEAGRAQERFRRLLKHNHIVSPFVNPSEVRSDVAIKLLQLKAKEDKGTGRSLTNLRKSCSIPFLRNARIVGRDQALDRLDRHVSEQLNDDEHRAVGVVGLAGIGKTQLLVEYAYRSIDTFTDGIYWINAAEPLADGFARLGVALNPALGSHSLEQQILCATDFLSKNKHALVVIDNIEDPRSLLRPIPLNVVPTALGCPIVFSSRRSSDKHFVEINLPALDEESAVRLLTNNWKLELRPLRSDVRYKYALAICQMLGMLPLALEIASSHLNSVTANALDRYRDLLARRGALPTLDGKLSRLDDVDLATRHSTAMHATLSSQWELLSNEYSKVLMLTIAQFPEGITLSQTLVRAIAPQPAEDDEVFDECGAAFRDLASKSLLEILSGDTVRLHPLVNEFCRSQITKETANDIRSTCVLRAADFCSSGQKLLAALQTAGTAEFVTDLSNVILLTDSGREYEEDQIGNHTIYSTAHSYLSGLVRVIRQESGRLISRKDMRSIDMARQLLLRARFLRQHQLATSMLSMLEEEKQDHFDLPVALSTQSNRLLRTIAGDWRSVHSAVICDDGQSVVVGTGRVLRKISIYNGGTEIQYHGHSGDIRCVSYSAGDRWLASGSDDSTIRVWNSATGELYVVLVGHVGSVRAVSFLSESCMVSASHDGTLRIWNLDNANCESVLYDFAGGVEDLSVDHKSQLALAGSRDGYVRIWDLNRGLLVNTIKIHKEAIECIIWLDGQTFATASLDGTAAIWNAKDNLCLHRYVLEHRVTTIAFSQERGLLLLGSDTSLILEARNSGIPETEILDGHSDRITALSVAPNSRICVSGAMDGTIRVWSMEEQVGRATSDVTRRGKQAVVCLTDNAEMMVSASEDGTISGWSASGNIRWQESIASSRGRPTCIAADGLFAAVGLESGAISFRNAMTGELAGNGAVHTKAISQMVLAAGRGVVAADDGLVSIWNCRDAEVTHISSDRRREVRSLAVNGAGDLAVSGALDGSVWIHTLELYSESRPLGNHENAVTAVASSIDGQTLWSASRDATVRLWPRDGRPYVELRDLREDIVNCLVVSPDGRWVVAGSRAGRVIAWEDQHRGEVRFTTELPGAIVALAFAAPDIVVAVTRTGVCQVIDLLTFRIRAKGELGEAIETATFSKSGRLAVLGGVADGLVRISVSVAAM